MVQSPQGTVLSLCSLPSYAALSISKVSWSTLTASSVYLASITQEILISDVLIIMILIPSLARAENILAATPECERMPTPMIDTLAISSLRLTPLAPISATTFFITSMTFLESVFGTVKDMSVSPPSPIFWMIMSTMILLSAISLNILPATPGLSGTPVTVTFTWFLSYATPDTTTFSMSESSLVTRVPGLSLKLESTLTGTLYFFANSTERVWSTLAPRLASSSISS